MDNYIKHDGDLIPKCYLCKHKETINGDAHIACNKPFMEMKGDEHGMLMGWFYYPINYDPVWILIDCPNFEKVD